MSADATTAVPRTARRLRSPCRAAVQNWRRRSAALGPVRLAALAALAVAGCPAVTPTTEPEFSGAIGELEFSFAVDREISPVVLPLAVGGRGRLIYSLDPELPPGLRFDPQTRTLSGTPTMAGSYHATYQASAGGGRSEELTIAITITAEPQADTGSIVSSVTVGHSAGVARSAGLPDPSGGPSVLVSGSEVFVAGGTVFLDIEPEPDAAVDKLLVAVGGQSDGYFEFDVADATAPYRLRGQVPFDVGAAIDSGCVPVAAVDAGGAVGPATCHEMSNAVVEFGEVQVTVSWDSDADVDLHVVDPAGEEIYSGQPTARSGGVLDFDSHCSPPHPRPFRNEHVAWSQGTPPDGAYVVRVNHRANCGAAETNYVVSVYNHGRVSTFPGAFSGPGNQGSSGAGRQITRFRVGDSAPPPLPPKVEPPETDGSFDYHGLGDQVFIVNPDWASLDDTLYALNLGGASAEVNVIATNPTRVEMSPEIAILGQSVVATYRDPPPRPAPSALPALPALPEEIIEFETRAPLTVAPADGNAHLQWQSRQAAVVEGDRFTFSGVPATARSVVTDGTMTATVWVGDDEWDIGCSGAGPCVTEEMADAMAGRFLRAGAGNDVYDWVTAIFGAPWGAHSDANLIPAEAAQHIHILLYDIDDDGAPDPGQCRDGGRFRSSQMYLNTGPGGNSSERLIFFMDSPLFATPEGDTWEVSDRRPSLMISVLAHEFQHMIHFYQKGILRGATSELWLNEMASEVAQDLIADKLMADGPRAVAYDDPTAGTPGIERGRLPLYNLFNDIRITVFRGTIANYAIVYALGAYLARTYGAELFQRIVQSDKAGVEAIEAALAALGHDVPFRQVLADWAVANLLSDNTAALAPYRYNPGTWTTSQAGGETFRLGSINLYNYRYKPPDIVPECYGPGLADQPAHEGPYLHSPSTFNAEPLQPHSNKYATLGRHSGTVYLQVRAPADSRITVVVKE